MADLDITQVSSQLDFGSGSVVVQNRLCLRSAKLPSGCDICLQACPVDAIVWQDERLVVTDDCIKCGLCMEFCPVGAFSTTRANLPQILLRLMSGTLKEDPLVICCSKAAKLLPGELQAKVIDVPCLGDLGAELWFYPLVEGDKGTFLLTPVKGDNRNVPLSPPSVFLPTGICSQCLVNLSGTAEELFSQAISTAESWSGSYLNLMSSPEEILAAGKKSLLQNLSTTEAGDRREVLENLFGSFRQSWQDAGGNLGQGNQKLKQIVEQRERNAKLTGVDLLASDNSIGSLLNSAANKPGTVDKGKLSPKRKAMIGALQDVPQIANQVAVLVSGTVLSQCKGCGNCVDACPLGARRMVNGNSAILFSDLSPETGPAAAQVAYLDPLICTGCSACIQHCPTGACVYQQLPGTELMKLVGA